MEKTSVENALNNKIYLLGITLQIPTYRPDTVYFSLYYDVPFDITFDHSKM